jgi:3-isopropylmalate/(R)-2-methylmalate dehydratase small subunit
MTMLTEGGRAWVFGDNVDTDVLAPGLYMKGPVEILASHCLEALEPCFAAEVGPGDVVVAGKNFGMGSSREQAAQVLRLLAVAVVVAETFAGIFYRNALNLGLPVVVCADAGRIAGGDRLAVDAAAGTVHNLSRGEVYECEPLPAHLVEMVNDGGLVNHLEKKRAIPRQEEDT